MKKSKLYFLALLFLLSGCSSEKEEPQPVKFCNEARSSLEKAINCKDGWPEIKHFDTLFTAKIIGTDSLFMIGYKFDIISPSARKSHFEYIYKNLHGKRSELLITTPPDKSIEELAKEGQKKNGSSYHDALFIGASVFLSIKGKEL